MATATVDPAMSYINNIARKKKTRRGKKRYKQELKTLSPTVRAHSCGFDNENSALGCVMCTAHISSSQMDITRSKRPGYSRKRRPIRPYTSPRAPHNSTQFLMSDGVGDFGFVNLGEHDNCLASEDEYLPIDQCFHGVASGVKMSDKDQCLSPDAEGFNWKTSPVYTDLDYEYKPISDSDMFTFLEKDFEDVFSTARSHQLEDQPKIELIAQIHGLEKSVEEMQSRLSDLQCSPPVETVEANIAPVTILSYDIVMNLQAELERLQQENIVLRRRPIVVRS